MLFNRFFFNRFLFNRTLQTSIKCKANIEVEALDLTAYRTQGASGEANIEVETSCSISELRQAIANIEVEATAIPSKKLHAAGAAEIIVAAQRIEVTVTAYLNLAFVGNLSPSSVLVIDTDNKTVELDGYNALHLFDFDNTDFWELLSGNNDIVYTDNESSRNLNIEVEFTERFV